MLSCPPQLHMLPFPVWGGSEGAAVAVTGQTKMALPTNQQPKVNASTDLMDGYALVRVNREDQRRNWPQGRWGVWEDAEKK